MSPLADRRIRHVRLRAPDEALLRRGALLLEDALRTATLAGDDGRLVVVRSLTVDRINTRSSPSELAVQLERRFRDARSLAVPAADPRAAHADAVVFATDAEPFVLLAERRAAGRPADAWFWPLVIPGWRPDRPRGEALRWLLFGSLQTTAGPAAALDVVRAVSASGRLDDLLATLSERDGAALRHAFGLATRPRPTSDRGDRASTTAPAGWRSALSVWSGRWGARDDRTIWTAAIALALAHPTVLADPRLADRAAALIDETATAGGEREQEPAGLIGLQKETSDAPAQAVPDRYRGMQASDVDSADGMRSPKRRIPPNRSQEPEQPPGFDTWADDERANGYSVARRRTACGGLLFLIPLFERLGMATLLAEHPALFDLNLPARVWRALADRCRVPVNDPLRGILTSGIVEGDGIWDWAAPPAWRGLVAGEPRVIAVAGETGRHQLVERRGTLVLGDWHGSVPAEVARWIDGEARGTRTRAAERQETVLTAAWMRAMDRWRRRHVGISWRELVGRAGVIQVTPTHLDLTLDLAAVDVRIRRAGLDLDPGWVPWLGRVVTFHYE